MLKRVLPCFCLLLVSSATARSIVIRHDRDDALYLSYAARFSKPVCQVATGGEGVLVEPQWVLTAAHVAESLGPFARYVRFGAERYEIQKTVLHPEWIARGIGGRRDVALLKLDRPVRGVEPVLLYAKADEAGKVVTFVGRGYTGTGLTGPVRERGRDLRAATNKVDEADETSIRMVFDAPPAGTELEGISGPGDSGGPALLEAGGRLYTLGVSSTNSGGDADHCTYGTTETYARVSTAREWIEKSVAADAPAAASAAAAWGPVVRLGGANALPEAPAGRAASAYFAAFNSGADAEVIKFNARHRAESFFKGRTPEQAARPSRELMDRFGPVELHAYSRLGELSLSVLTYSPRAKSWQAFTFALEPSPPHKLSGIGVSPAHAPR